MLLRVWLGLCRKGDWAWWDRLQLESGDLCARTRSSEEVHSWVVNIQLADDPFRSHSWKRAYKTHPSPNTWRNQRRRQGSCLAVTGSLTSPRSFFRGGIGWDEWATLVSTPFLTRALNGFFFFSKWLDTRMWLLFIYAHCFSSPVYPCFDPH